MRVANDPDSSVRTGVVACFVSVHDCVLAWQGPRALHVCCAEIFPLAQREQGMAWCVAFNFFWGSVLSLTFPRLLRLFTPLGAFLSYSGLNVVAFVIIFFCVPETKRLPLEEIDSVFSNSDW